MNVKISFANNPFVFHFKAKTVMKLLKRYSFFSHPGKRVCSFDVEFTKNSNLPLMPVITEKKSIVAFRRKDFDCVFDETRNEGLLRVNPRLQSFDSFLRVFLSWYLIRNSGFLVHAASAVINGRGYLFVGKSGAGKSTISKMMIKELGEKKFPLLTPPYTLYPIVLTDELSIVRIIGDKIRIYPSPFWGEMKNPRYETGAGGKNELEDLKEGVDLARIFFLKKSRKNKILSSPDRESYKNMLKCVMNFSKNKYAALNLMRSLSTILERIESSKLYFSKTGIFGELWRGQACK